MESVGSADIPLMTGVSLSSGAELEALARVLGCLVTKLSSCSWPFEMRRTTGALPLPLPLPLPLDEGLLEGRIIEGERERLNEMCDSDALLCHISISCSRALP